MNATSFGAAAQKPPATDSDAARPDRPTDAAWNVLEAANDLGDDATVEICRRVIDANLRGKPPSPTDLHIITEYFR